MCRRRFFKSYFYINYGGTAHGETVNVSPFVAAGGSDTIELVSARPWAITNNTSWLSVSSLSNRSGTHTITLTASENQSLDERTGSFTAKTLDDRYSIVVSVSQQPKMSNYFIYITPQQITLDAEASYDALQCNLYKDNWTFVDVVTPTWSVESEVITVDANGVVRSNNQTPEPVNGIEVSANYIYDGEELWNSATVNVRAANIQRYITVSPKSSSVGPTGSTSLTVIYHEIINEQHTQTDVTHSNNTVYSVDNPVFTVNDGTVTANNTGETDETATISITYPQTSGTTATITSSTAVIIEWVELGPDNFSLSYNDSETLEVVYVKSVNGVETRTEITDSTLLVFNLSDTDAARMNDMDLVNKNVSSNNKPVDVYVVYNGISSNTITATMLKPASLTYRLDVTADDDSVKYNGTTQMRATYVTVVNGVDYDSEEINPSNVTWSDGSSYASVSGNGVFQANNNSSATTRTATVTGAYNGVSGTTVITMGKKPGLDVYTPQEWHVSSAAGSCRYTVKWVNLKPGTVIELDSLNLDGYQPTSITITSNNYADDYEVIDATYLENQDPDERRLYLYASGVGLYDESLDDSDYYEQAGYIHTPVITYLLEVLPNTSATLDYGETTGFTVMYYVITDGQPDGGTDVTTLATYTNTGNNSTAITVSGGDVENVNTGVSTEVVTFSVSYGQADDVDVEITANPAIRDKVLVVTPNPETIDSDGTSQMLVEYQEWIGEDMVVQTQLAPSSVTWSITSGGEYASIDSDGEVTADNQTRDQQTVTVHGYYGAEDVSGDADITVRGADAPICSLVWDVQTYCGDTKCITVAAYRAGTYQGEDVLGDVAYITQNVRNIYMTILSDTDEMIESSTVDTSDESVSFVFAVNSGSSERFAIVRIEGDGDDGNTYHDDLIIFQEAGVTPYLLIENTIEYTEARSTPDGANLEFDLDFGYVDTSSVDYTFAGATSGNIGSVSVNATNGKLYVTLDANENPASATSDVYVTATTVYGDTISAHLIITQPAPIRVLDISVQNPVSSNEGGYCSGMTISWTGLTINSTIDISFNPDELDTGISIVPVTATTGSRSFNMTPQVMPNSGSARTVRITATWLEDSSVTDYDEWLQDGGYVPPVIDCNFSLSYDGLNPIPYSASNVTFKLYYGDDVNTNSIGVIDQHPAIIEIDLEEVAPGEMNVNVELTPNCGSSNRTFPFTLSARCDATWQMVSASSYTVEQEHQEGYPVTVANNVYALVINNTNQDIYLNGLQVYSKNDCSSTNLYQFPYGQSETIPANSQKQVMSVIGSINRPNDDKIWGDWSFSNLPQNSYTSLVAGGFQIAEPGMEGAADITHATSITPGNIILQVRMS